MNLRYFIPSIFILILATTSALANQKTEMPKATPTHIVGFTFHKLAETEPNYSKWVDVYLENRLGNLGEEGKKEKIRRTKASFRNNFRNFLGTDLEPIIIHFPAKVEIIPFESRYLMNITVGGGLDFIIKETPEFLINLVVPELADKLKPVISEDDYKDIKKASGLQFDTPQSIMLVLELIPVGVDSKEPVKIGEDEYWLMLMDFSTYEIWHPKGYSHFWDYISEEEKKERLQELRSLYKEDKETNEQNEVIDDFAF